MNILFCNYEYPPLGGGGGVVNAWLAEALTAEHNVTVLTSSADGLSEDEVVNGVRIVRVPVYFRKERQTANMPSMAVFVLNGARKGAKLVRENQFDIINTHFVLPTGPVGSYLSKKANIPNVLSVHGGDLYDPSKFMSPHRHFVLRNAAKKILRAADAVVGQSQNTNANVATYYDPDINCELIPLGIPRVEQPPSQRARHDIAEDDLVLITVGRLVSRKGLDQLVEMMSITDNPKMLLIVMGDGPKMEELKHQAVALGVANRIRFAGHTSDEDKLSLLSSADLYVSTSQHEGFGLVFLEGMAAGLPVVCYDHGGQADFIVDGENGFLVKLNDKDTFRDRVERLAKDTALRESLAVKAKHSVENYFIDRCALSYVEVFERCIAASNAERNKK